MKKIEFEIKNNNSSDSNDEKKNGITLPLSNGRKIWKKRKKVENNVSESKSKKSKIIKSKLKKNIVEVQIYDADYQDQLRNES